MTIVERIRQIAGEIPSTSPNLTAERLYALAGELDARADELVSVGRTHYACELAAQIGGKGYVQTEVRA